MEGGGRSNSHNRNRGVCLLFFCPLPGSPGESETRRVTFSTLSRDTCLHRLTLMFLPPLPSSSQPLRSVVLSTQGG